MHLVRALRAYTHILLPLLSGVLYLCAFYVPGTWFLIFIALVPLLYSLVRASSLRGAVLRALLFGVVVTGGTTVCILEFTVVVSESFSLGAWLLKFASYGVTILPLASSVAIWGWLVYKLQIKTAVSVFVLAGSWAVLEYLRMHMFNVMTYEPQVVNPAFFSSGFIGYPLADNNTFLQLARLGGVYAMGFLVVVVNGVAYQWLRFGRNNVKFFWIGSFLLPSVLLFSFFPLSKILELLEKSADARTVSIGLVSFHGATLEQELMQSFVVEMREKQPDMIVLPEGARFFSRGGEVGTPETGTLLVDSDEHAASGRRREVFAAFSGTSEERRTYVRSKLVLTPQGEYPISIVTGTLALLGLNDVGQRIENISRYSTGETGDPVYVREDIRASVLFCIEMLAPGLGKTLVRRQDADMLVVLVSQSYFSYSYTLRRDTLRYLAVQAVEAGVPLVASSHQAPAYALDKFGRVMALIGAGRVSEWDVVPVPL